MKFQGGNALLKWITTHLLIRLSVIVCTLSATFSMGQLIKVKSILWFNSIDQSLIVIQILILIMVVLLEAILPIACIFTVIFIYSGLKNSNISIQWSRLGHSHTSLFIPVVLITIISSLIGILLAHHATPTLLTQIAQLTEQAQASQIKLGADAIKVLGGQNQIQVGRTSNMDSLLIMADSQSASLIIGQLDAQNELNQFILRNTHIISATLNMNVEKLTIEGVNPSEVIRSEFKPPATTPTWDLEMKDPHHRFMFHKRSSMPLTAIPWGIIGALLGLRVAKKFAIPATAVMILLSYWLLRLLELNCRFNDGNAVLAAWSPFILAVLIFLCSFYYWRKSAIECR